MYVRKIFITFLLLANLRAEDSYLETLFKAEAAAISVATILTYDPNFIGGFSAIIAPLTLTEQTNTEWVVFLEGEALAIYNWNIDMEKTSRIDVFKDNFIAMNMIMLSVFVSGLIFDDVDFSASVAPTEDKGFQLALNYKF